MKKLMIATDMRFVRPRHNWKQLSACVGVFALIITGLIVFLPQAYGSDGGGGQGGTGSGSGCNQTSSCTNYGVDWLRFASSSNANPSGFQSFVKNANGTRTQWADVATTCRNTGNDSVWVYVAYYKNNLNKFQGLNYVTSGRLKNNQYYLNRQISQNGAYTNYLQANFRDPSWIWGQNVAWFCWNSNPPWTISVSSSADRAIAEIGDTITWTSRVTNNGAGTTNTNITWRYQNRGDWPNTPGTNWTFGSGQGAGASNTNYSTYTVQASDFGKKLCRATSANPSDNKGAGWVESAAACVSIAKKPKVQVWGGDLQAGATLKGQSATIGNISTSVSQKASGVAYGSWDEYAVRANGTVKGIGAGAAFNFKNGLVGYTSCNVSQLVLTNAGAGTCNGSTALGQYASSQNIPDVAAVFPISNSTPIFKNLGDATQRRVETASGTVNVGGATINRGDWVVLNAPTAIVTITGDINYTSSTLSSVYDIPQVIIIANCINIAGNVQNIDAWLIAVGQTGTNTSCDGIASGGVINTCSDVAPGGNLSAAQCSNTLRVNGPVMTRHLYMQRTSGSDTDATAGSPAEVFNLRPDAYLWLAQRSITAGYVQAAYTTELPPRF